MGARRAGGRTVHRLRRYARGIGPTWRLASFRSVSSTPDFHTAEWGFALGSPFWGSGLFVAAAHLAIAYAFEVVGVHRLEARAATVNGRGNGALAKLGAVREACCAAASCATGGTYDQALWSIVREDRQQHTRRCGVGDSLIICKPPPGFGGAGAYL